MARRQHHPQLPARPLAQSLVLVTATLAGRSLSSFKRDFRRVYGAAPGAWLIRERLAYAAQRLAEDELSVTEVCLASGFGDLSHFIRSFRRRYAESPKQYRQRLQGDHRGA